MSMRRKVTIALILLLAIAIPLFAVTLLSWSGKLPWIVAQALYLLAIAIAAAASFLGQWNNILSLVDRMFSKPSTTVLPDISTIPAAPVAPSQSADILCKVSFAKLPSTSPDLFGREDRLKELDAAWDNPAINIFSLVAWGGVGKSALVNKWLTQMGADNYRGAERVYGWSFYSQGAAEGRQVSADQFIAAALTCFGDPDPTAGSP